MEAPNHNFIANGFVSHNSGPEVLEECLDFITTIFIGAQGRRLSPLEIHDIACCIGFCSISGGVRRTALISIFDSWDKEMLHCKDGDEVLNYRWFANNSAVFEKEPTKKEFDRIANALFNGKRGEPGFYFLNNAQRMAPERRDGSKIAGLNPCVTGDTLVYTADGRTDVTIKELADNGILS